MSLSRRWITNSLLMALFILFVSSCSVPTPPTVASVPDDALPEPGEHALLAEVDNPSESEALEQPASRAISAPQRLGIYYGWPSAALSIGESMVAPEALFSQFSVVVFGGSLAEPNHPDHAETLALIDALIQQGVEIYGYIDMGMTTRPGAASMADLAGEIGRWRAAGVTGVFWDDAGYEFTAGLDFLAYRQRLAEIVARTHEAGLTAFLNAWNPDDLFRETAGGGEALPEVPIAADDLVLAESWFVTDGRLEQPMPWHERAEKLAGYQAARPFRLACVSTGDDRGEVIENDLFQAAYWAAVMAQCDLFQYTNPHYSATGAAEGNHLLVTPLPAIPAGENFSGGVQVHPLGALTEFLRPTDSGEIVVGSDGAFRGYGGYRPGEASP
jgi:hypothetical protein